MARTRSGKKDFDMERMFQKLVPSLQGEILPLPDLGPEIPAESEILPASGGGPVNLMELILLEKMPHTMKMLRACDCESCKNEILAHALNQLPPAYEVDEAVFEEKMLELRRQYEVKITSALITAVQRLKAERRHG